MVRFRSNAFCLQNNEWINPAYNGRPQPSHVSYTTKGVLSESGGDIVLSSTYGTDKSLHIPGVRGVGVAKPIQRDLYHPGSEGLDCGLADSGCCPDDGVEERWHGKMRYQRPSSQWGTRRRGVLVRRLEIYNPMLTRNIFTPYLIH